jgi:hypothetical protein
MRAHDRSLLARPSAACSRHALLAAACAAALAWAAFAPGVAGAAGSGGSGGRSLASASLAQCVGAQQQAERAVTFAGEMTAVTGTARMEIRIEVLERLPDEATFHVVLAPGLGVWRAADPGVKVFKYLKQVTNLAAPAFYRASVRFRWLNARSHPFKTQYLRTAQCEQSVPSPEAGAS